MQSNVITVESSFEQIVINEMETMINIPFLTKLKFSFNWMTYTK